MKRLFAVLLLVLSLVVLTTAVVSAGQTKSTLDVCWMQGDTEVRADFILGRNGTVHEWRYAPEKMVLKFRDQDDFAQPGDDWIAWHWNGGDWGQYAPCDPSSEDTLGDALGYEPSWFWVYFH